MTKRGRFRVAATVATVVAVIAVTAVFPAMAGSATVLQPECGGLDATIVGTGGSDQIVGTSSSLVAAPTRFKDAAATT
jgi:hypothetical protein